MSWDLSRVPAVAGPRTPTDEDLYRDLPSVGDPWRENELVRRLGLRESATRPVSENLAETLAFSEFICSFAGSANRVK